jgi:hypothetical protein
MRGGEATSKPSPVHLSSTTGCWQVPADQVATPSHSRSARRLGELLHEDSPSSLTTPCEQSAEAGDHQGRNKKEMIS